LKPELRPGVVLSDHQLDHQIESLAKTLTAFGSIDLVDAPNPDAPWDRFIYLRLSMPNWGLPEVGAMHLKIWLEHVPSQGGWQITEYVHEYRQATKLIFALHYHPLDGGVISVPHLKCLDEARHYEAEPVSAHEAAAYFVTLDAGESPDCREFRELDW
jgi:hypothetical protein